MLGHGVPETTSPAGPTPLGVAFCWPPPALPCQDPQGHRIPIINEGEHEQPLLDEPLPLGVLALQVAVVVIGDDDTVLLVGHLHDIAVIVADHPLAVHLAGRGVHQHLLPLQLLQHMLLWGPQGRWETACSSFLGRPPHPRAILRSRSTSGSSGVLSWPTPASLSLSPAWQMRSGEALGGSCQQPEVKRALGFCPACVMTGVQRMVPNKGESL